MRGCGLDAVGKLFLHPLLRLWSRQVIGQEPNPDAG